MKRRHFLRQVALATMGVPWPGARVHAAEEPKSPAEGSFLPPTSALRKEWFSSWRRYILREVRNRYCATENGEGLGWFVSPYLEAFYYGYLATRDTTWVEWLIDWMDACAKRTVREPDGFVGWPRREGNGKQTSGYAVDSLLGEAMLLRPVVLMAGEIQRTPRLQKRWGPKAQRYMQLAAEIFHKWDARDCWRSTQNGGVWVAPDFGLEPKSNKWTAGFEQRKTTGFTNPNNKENLIARWVLAMHEVTGEPIYLERAKLWFQVMKARIKTREGGKYLVWNYWEPAGPWDYAGGSPRHWIGVHPNGGYYEIDVEAIVSAFEHHLVFDQTDIDRLIATNRDFMWNRQVVGAKFQRIDGRPPDPRWKNSGGTLWNALVPYDATLAKVFVANHHPSGWAGMITTPWFLSLSKTER